MADTKSTLLCPACNTEMKKIFLPGTGFSVDVCVDGCGGLFLDNRELQYIDEPDEDIDAILNEVKGKEFKKVNQEIARYCPSCGAKMVKNSTSVLQNIQIDECYSCGGKFFDHGELVAMRAEYTTDEDRTDAVINAVMSVCGEALAEQAMELEQRRKERSKFRRLLHALLDD